MKIEKVVGYQVLDSRGRPTVAAAITLADGTTHTRSEERRVGKD